MQGNEIEVAKLAITTAVREQRMTKGNLVFKDPLGSCGPACAMGQILWAVAAVRGHNPLEIVIEAAEGCIEADECCGVGQEELDIARAWARSGATVMTAEVYDTFETIGAVGDVAQNVGIYLTMGADISSDIYHINDRGSADVPVELPQMREIVDTLASLRG